MKPESFSCPLWRCVYIPLSVSISVQADGKMCQSLSKLSVFRFCDPSLRPHEWTGLAVNPVSATPYRSDYLLEVQSPQLKNEHSNTYRTAILAPGKHSVSEFPTLVFTIWAPSMLHCPNAIIPFVKVFIMWFSLNATPPFGTVLQVTMASKTHSQ